MDGDVSDFDVSDFDVGDGSVNGSVVLLLLREEFDVD